MDSKTAVWQGIVWLIVGLVVGGVGLGSTVFKQTNTVPIIQIEKEEVEKLVTVTKNVTVPAREFSFTHGTQTIDVTEAYVISLLEAKGNSGDALEDLFKEARRDMEDEFDDIDRCGNETFDDDEMRMVDYGTRSYVQRENDDDDEYKIVYTDAEIEYDDGDDECERTFDEITIRYDGNDVDVDFDEN